MNKICEEILKREEGWLFEPDQDFIFHNDHDGLLTALFCTHFLGWHPVGMYDLKKLWLSKNFNKNINTPIYVDLDITDPDIHCIGHHILLENHSHAMNVNDLFNVTPNNYTCKYPLNTVLFLIWLFNAELPTNKRALLMLLNADSVYDNYDKYNRNVTTWLQRFNLGHLSDILKDNDMRPIMEKFVFPYTSNFNNQCGFQCNNGKLTFVDKAARFKSVIEFVKYMEDIFGWTGLSRELSTKSFDKCIELERRTCGDGLNSNPLDEYLKLKQTNFIFSHSLKKRSLVDVSIMPRQYCANYIS